MHTEYHAILQENYNKIYKDITNLEAKTLLYKRLFKSSATDNVTA